MTTTGYPSDLSAAQWALIEPHLPRSKPGGRPRQTDMYEVVNAIFYLLRSGCQWQLSPKGRSGGISGVGAKRVSGSGFTKHSTPWSGPRPGGDQSTHNIMWRTLDSDD